MWPFINFVSSKKANIFYRIENCRIIIAKTILRIFYMIRILWYLLLFDLSYLKLSLGKANMLEDLKGHQISLVSTVPKVFYMMQVLPWLAAQILCLFLFTFGKFGEMVEILNFCFVGTGGNSQICSWILHNEGYCPGKTPSAGVFSAVKQPTWFTGDAT